MSAPDRCPACQMPVAADARFCPYCTAEVGRPEGPAVRLERPDTPERPDAPESPAAARGFEASYCAPRILRTGLRSSLFFQVSSDRDDLTDGTLTLKNGDTTIASARVPFPCGDCKMNVTPSLPGNLYLDLDLRLEFPGGAETHTADFHIAVEEKAPAPQQIVVAPQISNSGVLRLENGDLFNAAGVAAPAVQTPGADLDRYACDRSVRHPLAFTLARSPAALTLVSADGRSEILLFAKDRILCGRRATADVTLPVYRAGAYDDYLSRHVSGGHFSLGLEGDRCTVADGTAEKPSVNGLCADGARLPPGGARTLAAGASHRLAVMAAPGGGDELIPFTVRVCGDRWTQPSGCLLARADGVGTRAALVWRAAGVDLAADACVGWDGARFITGRGRERRPLAVGDTLTVGGVPHRVAPFHQRSPVNELSTTQTERNEE